MNPEKTIVAQIEQADAARRAAMVAKDADALARLICPDAIYMHNNGRAETGQEFVAAVRAGKYDYSAVEMANCQFRVIGDVVVVSGTQTIAAVRPDGVPVRIDVRAVVVWQRQGGDWVLVHYQSTLPTA